MSKKEKEVNLLENAHWQFAKLMPNSPHFYTIVRTWKDNNEFNLVRKFVFDNMTHEESFFGKPYKYFFHGDWKYWVMDADVKNVILINEAKIENRYD